MIKTARAILVLLAMSAMTALADPEPVEPNKVASPWTFPIALLVLAAIVAFVLRPRR